MSEDIVDKSRLLLFCSLDGSLTVAGVVEGAKFWLNASAMFSEVIADLSLGKTRKFTKGSLSWDLTLCNFEWYGVILMSHCFSFFFPNEWYSYSRDSFGQAMQVNRPGKTVLQWNVSLEIKVVGFQGGKLWNFVFSYSFVNGQFGDAAGNVKKEFVYIPLGVRR